MRLKGLTFNEQLSRIKYLEANQIKGFCRDCRFWYSDKNISICKELLGPVNTKENNYCSFFEPKEKA